MRQSAVLVTEEGSSIFKSMGENDVYQPKSGESFWKTSLRGEEWPERKRSHFVINPKRRALAQPLREPSGLEEDKENRPEGNNRELQVAMACLDELDKNQAQLKQRTAANCPYVSQLKREHSARTVCKSLATTLNQTQEAPQRLPLELEYYASTDMGTHRQRNEDRVSIVERVYKHSSKYTPCSYFGLYDGHAGEGCSTYLKDHLAELIVKDESFKEDKVRALEGGLKNAETTFLALARQKRDYSGSCCLALVVDAHQLFFCNLGDSRAVISSEAGARPIQVTHDHKPENIIERTRIIKAGGAIYRTTTTTKVEYMATHGGLSKGQKEKKTGPYRVEPGNLSVSRTIGDLKAKDPEYKGNGQCVIATPDCFERMVGDRDEFIVMACDGVFDVLSNEDVTQTVYNCLVRERGSRPAKECCKAACEAVIQLSKQQKSTDNLTVIVILLRPISAL